MYCGLRSSRLLAKKLRSSCGSTFAENAIARDKTRGSVGGTHAAAGASTAVHADEAVVDLSGDHEVWSRQYGWSEAERFDGETEEEVVHGALR